MPSAPSTASRSPARRWQVHPQRGRASRAGRRAADARRCAAVRAPDQRRPSAGSGRRGPATQLVRGVAVDRRVGARCCSAAVEAAARRRRPARAERGEQAGRAGAGTGSTVPRPRTAPPAGRSNVRSRPAASSPGRAEAASQRRSPSTCTHGSVGSCARNDERGRRAPSGSDGRPRRRCARSRCRAGTARGPRRHRRPGPADHRRHHHAQPLPRPGRQREHLRVLRRGDRVHDRPGVGLEPHAGDRRAEQRLATSVSCHGPPSAGAVALDLQPCADGRPQRPGLPRGARVAVEGRPGVDAGRSPRRSCRGRPPTTTRSRRAARRTRRRPVLVLDAGRQQVVTRRGPAGTARAAVSSGPVASWTRPKVRSRRCSPSVIDPRAGPRDAPGGACAARTVGWSGAQQAGLEQGEQVLGAARQRGHVLTAARCGPGDGAVDLPQLERRGGEVDARRRGPAATDAGPNGLRRPERRDLPQPGGALEGLPHPHRRQRVGRRAVEVVAHEQRG